MLGFLLRRNGKGAATFSSSTVTRKRRLSFRTRSKKSRCSHNDDNDDSSEASLQQQQLEKKTRKKHPLHSPLFRKDNANVYTTKTTAVVSLTSDAAAADDPGEKISTGTMDVASSPERTTVGSSSCTSCTHETTTAVAATAAAECASSDYDGGSVAGGGGNDDCAATTDHHQHHPHFPRRRRVKQQRPQTLQREFHDYYPFALEASWIVLWYCAGLYSLYMVVDMACQLVKERLLQLLQILFDVPLLPDWWDDLFYALVIACGFMAMRWNGHLWEWLPMSSYKERRRRRRAGDAEHHDHHDPASTTTNANRQTIVSSWRLLLEQHPFWNSTFSTVTFYSVYVGTVHFYYRLWAAYETAWSSCYKAWETTMQSQGMSDEEPIHMQILVTVRTWVCQHFQNPSLPLPCLLFHGSLLLVASRSMALIGGTLLGYEGEDDEEEDEEE